MKTVIEMAREALMRMRVYGDTFAYRSNEQTPYEQVCEALEALEALAEQHEMTNIERYERNLQKFLAEQPAQQEPATTDEFREGWKAARQFYTAPQAQQEPVSNAEISAWAERHDINGTPLSLRCMVEDAASLHLTTTPQAQPAQQEPEHIVHSNGRYSPLLTRMMNERVKSNVKQVIELYDSPEQPAQQEPFGFAVMENPIAPPAQQEPVGYVAENGVVDWNICAPPIMTDLYTSPPAQRKPLSNEQIGQAAGDAYIAFCLNRRQTYEHALTRAIEAAHGIKENT